MAPFKGFYATHKAQIGRFVRLFGTALLATGIVPLLLHGTASRDAVIAAVVGAVEVTFRQLFPPTKA